MVRTPGILAGILLLAGLIQAQPATVPTSQPLSSDDLAILFQRELGDRYRPADAPKLLAAHAQLERYFSATDTTSRSAARDEIARIGLDVSDIGRLARIRANWPALAGGVYYVNEKIGPSPVHYFLGIPENYDRLKPWPLVVRLPTAATFVTEPRPDAEQVAHIYSNWILAELKAHPDAIVIMPLLNLDELYGPSYAGMNSVIKPIFHAADRANIDPARVYLFGQAMSAHAVWNLALHYPTYFAGINPLAGGASADWQRLRMMNLRNIRCVVWHDAGDKIIRVNSSREIVNILRRFKIDVDYEETKDIGHDPTDAILTRTYERTRSAVRDLYPRQITLQSNRLDAIFNRIDWLQIYQPLNIGEDKRLVFRRGSGIMLVQSTTWSADVTRNANRFELTTKNVDVLRLYVNDQMVNFAEPVTVVVNKKTRFEGIVQPSLDELLQDQLFLGRGWRYFSGVIDIDLSEKPATQP